MRFANPHMQMPPGTMPPSGHYPQGQMQPGQQGMPMYPPNMPMQQGMPMYNPNQPIYPNMPMQPWQQGMSMQQGMPMYPNMPMQPGQQGMPMYPPNMPMQQPFNQQQRQFMPQQMPNIMAPPSSSNRFGPPAQQPMAQPLVQPSVAPVQPVITPHDRGMMLQKIEVTRFPELAYNITTKTTNYTKESILNYDSLSIVDCVDEAVEIVMDLVHSNDVSSDNIYHYELFVTDFAHGVKNNNLLDIINTSTEAQAVATGLNVKYKLINNKEDLISILSIDDEFTNFINDVIKINTNFTVSIDSFKDDYTDLIDVLKNNPTLQDFVVKKVNAYIAAIKDSIEVAKKTGEINTDCLNSIDKINIYYIDALDIEFNLNMLVEGEFVQLPTITGKYLGNGLFSIVNSILETKNTESTERDFILTYDKMIFEVFKNLEGKYFIRKM